MLLPLSCDAPIYHWPFATVGLMATNIFVYIIAWNHISADEMALMTWVLVHGNGLHPLQWLTSMFMHAGWMHLIGNLLFLWIFGLVVEGKLGWWKFLVVYLGIGISQSAFEQVVMLGLEWPSYSLGASSAIYGLMLMAVVWAPKNEINCFYWFAIVAMGTVDIPIIYFAMIYLALDFLQMVLAYSASGSFMSTGWLHLTGGLIGAALGTVLVKRNLVDCEGWDLFRVWNGADPKQEPDYENIDRRVQEKKLALEEDQLVLAKRQFDLYLTQDNFRAAAVLWKKLRSVRGGLQLEHKELATLVRGLLGQREWSLAAPLLANLIERFPAGTDAARIKLAEICVLHLEKPARALELLKSIDFSRHPPERLQQARKIASHAKQLQADGVYEIDDDSF